MKHKLALVLFIAALSSTPLVAADVSTPKSSPVEQKFRELDLAIIFKQYEHVKTLLADIRMQRELLFAEVGMTVKERNAKLEAFRLQQDLLQHLCRSYRDEAVALEKQIDEADLSKTSK